MSEPARKSKLLKGATGDWEVVIGLEVHAQVTSEAKLFSGAATAFGGEPNSQVSLVDAAMPGMLPVINAECIRQAVRTGLGLNAKINLRSVFDRKNYFYPDLPQGYQISQYKSPIVGEGEVAIDMPDGEAVRVGIERVHLEQDAGKLLHDQHPSMSFVDLNRSGVALMEIVSKPDLRSADEAKAYVSKLRTILRYLGTCDGDMEKGNLRADVNVSVRKPGEPFGTRCEIKNVNSIRFIGQAVEYEARRQVDLIEDGGTVEQETRLFDPNKGETRPMRSKEEAHDYRYFPDPDLLPLEMTQAEVDALKAQLPELPDQKKARFIRDYALTVYDADVLTAEREAADYFEDVARGRDAKAAANWVINELAGRLNKEGKDILASPISSSQLGAILDLIAKGTISGKIAKDVFEIVWSKGGDPHQIVKEGGMEQVTDLSAIEKVVDDIVAANPDKVEQAKNNPKLVGWFVGQAMKASGGKANPQAVNELLKTKLGEPLPNRKRSREVLFEERERTRQQPLRPGESLFDFYDECAREGYDAFRSTINNWLSEIPTDDRAKLISRMQNAGNAAFGAALCELVTHALLVRLKYKIVLHPVVQGADTRPDFAVTDEHGTVLCYVEVTTVNRADEMVAEKDREAAIYNAIDNAKLPKGCLLGYTLVQAGSEKPDLTGLVESIEQWALENVDRPQAGEVVRRFAAGEWIVELELFSGGDAPSGPPAIGVASIGGGVIAPAKDVREALRTKAGRYGAMDAPYLIVVADAKDQMFGKDSVRDAVVEAIFGDEKVNFATSPPRIVHSDKGFWFGPDGPRNQHVSGILLLSDTGIWKLRDEKRQPVLAVNSCATRPLPDPIQRLTRLEAHSDKWTKHNGLAFPDVLGLPSQWPPEER